MADGIGLAWSDMVIDACFFLSLLVFNSMGDFGMEIAYLVKVSFHLVRRTPGLCGVVIDGFIAESRVHPFPEVALGPLLRFVVDPCRQIGFKRAFVRLK